MSVFELYLRLGIEHIADFKGYDHILFVLSISIVYSIKQWKKLLILITAFTIGHSLTLVLATLKIIKRSVHENRKIKLKREFLIAFIYNLCNFTLNLFRK